MDLTSYTRQTTDLIAQNRLPHAIIVETENMTDALFYTTNCVKAILKTDHLENHPDFFTLLPTGKINIIKIEAIRELIGYAQKTPNVGEQKVFVIFDAHRLNKSAANALLKILEEPPADTTLFLTTHSKNSLLSTIISRCILHHLPENFTIMLPQAFAEWLNQLDVILQELSKNRKTLSILAIFFSLETLAQSLEQFADDDDEIKNMSTKDIQRILLESVAEKIWNIFHLKLPAHTVEQMIKIISKSSLLLAVNGSFSHVIESILLQLYEMNIYENYANEAYIPE
jgi:hypothetical protein